MICNCRYFLGLFCSLIIQNSPHLTKLTTTQHNCNPSHFFVKSYLTITLLHNLLDPKITGRVTFISMPGPIQPGCTDNCPGDNCPGRQLSQGDNCPRGITSPDQKLPRQDNCPGRQLPQVDNCPSATYSTKLPRYILMRIVGKEATTTLFRAKT